MNEYTPEKVAELVAKARKLLFSDSAFGYEDTKEGDLILRLADALTAVSAERDSFKHQAEHFAMRGNIAEADRDRLHKAITEALEILTRGDSADSTGEAWRILRAALDKEGRDS